MKIVQFLDEHAVFLLALFAIGCAVSLVREFHEKIPANRSRLLKLLEWCLLPPGFAVIFITLQQHSVRYFALHPVWTVATFLAVAVLSALLLVAQRKKHHVLLTWLGGLLGAPGAAFSIILVGLFFLSPGQFQKIRATYINVAATQGRIAPDFSFILHSSGEEQRLSDYRGRVVLLNIWATWCIPCLKEMPALDKLQKKYGSANLVVINLSDESLEAVDKYLSRYPMVTTHGRVDARNVPEFYQFGGARPASFLIGAGGEVLESILGAGDLGYFERIVTPHLLAENDGA